MIKKLLGFALLLVAIGTGFSLYLPEYQAADINLPSHATIVVESSLTTPVNPSALRPSSMLFSDSPESVIYALQLGLFGSLGDAQSKGHALYQQANGIFTSPLQVFKTQDQQRYWYILALGPLKSQAQVNQYSQLLEEQNINSQEILWPFDTED